MNIFVRFFLLIILFFISFSSYAWQEKWKSEWVENKFDGGSVVYFTGLKTKPSSPLEFPYKKTYSRLIVGCTTDKGLCNVYLKFNEINLNGGDIYPDGSLNYRVRIKLDSGKIKKYDAYIDSGSKLLRFYKPYKIIKHMNRNKQLVVELNHYGSGIRYHTYITEGFKEEMIRYWKEPNKVFY